MKDSPLFASIIIIITGLLCLIYVEYLRRKEEIDVFSSWLYIAGIMLIIVGVYKLITYFL